MRLKWMAYGICIGDKMAKEIRETWSEELNGLIDTLKEGGPSEEELCLMGVIAIMDETFRAFANCPGHQDAVFQTYFEIEEYLRQEGVGH